MSGRALVLDATNRQSVVAIRNLGRRGISVTAGGYRPRSAGHLSKYADKRITYPTPWERPAEFADAIVEEVRAHEYDVLLVSGEKTAEIIIANRDRLSEHVGLPYPPYETFQVALDTHETLKAAETTEISIPATVEIQDLDRETVSSAFSYPVVVKPARSQGRNGVVICQSYTEVQEAWNQVRRRFDKVLLQEYIPNGGEVGVYTLYDSDSNRRAATVQERVRSFPAEGGASTCRRTIDGNDLIDCSDQLLSAIDWQGVAMVEFRIDGRTGRPQLMEINGRLWGSLALSVAAGVDFPYLLYQLGETGECDEVPSYSRGIYARRLLGELAHIASREDSIKAFREVLRPTSGPCEFDLLSSDDPLPILGHLMETGHGLTGELRSRNSIGSDRRIPRSVTQKINGYLRG